MVLDRTKLGPLLVLNCVNGVLTTALTDVSKIYIRLLNQSRVGKESPLVVKAPGKHEKIESIGCDSSSVAFTAFPDKND